MHATAFGLDVESEMSLSLLAGASARPTGRTLELSGCGGDELKSQWPAGAQLVCDERQPDGTVNFQIESHREAGYLISGPRFGAFRLSGDGRELVCAPDGVTEHVWQRLLIAQVLPFAALLRGLEVFHASAVVWGTEAIAFLGPSGAGKTSLALELCERGASFLADDVLALERAHERLLAHPGTPVAGVARAGAEDGHAHDPLAVQVPADGELVAVNERERLVRVRGAVEPAALSTLLFLERRQDGPDSPSFEPAADAQLLLGATFNFVLSTPERLRGLLEVCAAAAQLRVERIVCGPRVGVAELGEAVEERLGAGRGSEDSLDTGYENP
ncbi:MAG TPA: hypothetical protein VK765_07260 [Solirubrobacteraceae bacterium]|jgi:hypothetical protein|nr:hypothetical protein [Solirubrobacteraceae bacterium]